MAIKLLESGQLVQKTIAQSIEDFREFHHEAYLMSLLNHPNVVRFVGVCFPSELPREEHHRSPGMLMEVVPGGQLYDSLRNTLGLRTVATLTEKIMKTIGQHTTAKALHVANPAKFPTPPPPMPDLLDLCDGALRRINQTFMKRVLPRFTEKMLTEQAGAVQLRDRVVQAQEELNGLLQRYYVEPLSKQLDNTVADCIERIDRVAIEANDMLVPIKWPLRLKLATDVAQGMIHLHSLQPPLVHRDLKSPNIFMSCRLDELPSGNEEGEGGIAWNEPIAKVGDFGLSVRMLGTGELHAATEALHGITPTWAAPEVLSKGSYSTEADIYALGIMLWELLTRRHPFDHMLLSPIMDIAMRKLAEKIRQGERPEVLELDAYCTLTGGHPAVVADYVALMQACWDPNPDCRPTILQIYSQLRQLARLTAPALYATLPDIALPDQHRTDLSNGSSRARSSAMPRFAYSTGVVEILKPAFEQVMQANAENSNAVAFIELLRARRSRLGKMLSKISRIDPSIATAPGQTRALQVLCIRHVEGQRFWLGFSHGDVALIDLQAAAARPTVCAWLDRHAKGVNTLSFNLFQQKTVWSGASDGRIFVWRASAQTLAEAKAYCFLKGLFKIAESTYKRIRVNKTYYAVVRSGRLHFYEDEFVGPAIEEIDLCRAEVLTSVSSSDESLNIALKIEPPMFLALRAHSKEQGRSSLEIARQWQQSIGSLAHLSQTGLGLCRVATSTPRDQAIVTELETIDDSTWSLSLTSVYELTEWSLRAAHHGLDHTLKLEPCRRITIDMSTKFESRMRIVANLLWVAPDLVWLSVANSVVAVDLSPAAPFWAPGRPKKEGLQALEWSRNPDAPKHQDVVKLMALVVSNTSPTGSEVWTYAYNEELLVWQTPTVTEKSDCISPEILLARIPALPKIDGEPPMLTSLRQTNPSQVWAGTAHGTLVGWDIATRELLPVPILTLDLGHRNPDTGRPRAVSALALPDQLPTPYVLSTGLEPTLRKIELKSFQRR